MQPLWSIITLVALTAPSMAPKADGSSEGVMAAVEFDRMDFVAQHEWIRTIIVRLDRANQLVLPPDKAAQHKARYAVLLRQISQGKRVSPAEAEDLLRQTDRREKAAIEQLARRFRIQVYQTFRQRRGTFTRRRAAWNRVLAGWEAAGGSFEEQDRLIDWLRAAIRVSLPDSVGPLPAEPEFKIVGLAPEAIVFHGPTSPITPPTIAAPTPRTRLSDRNRAAIAPPPFAQPGMDTPEPHPLPPLASSTNVRRDIVESQVTRGATPVAQRQATGRQDIVSPPAASAVAAEPPILAEPPPQTTPQTTSVRVNVEELAARTAGVNLAIRALEAELDRRGPWNSIRLRPLIDQLGRLMNRSSDLTLFHQILAKQQRASVGRLDSPETLISQVAARIFEARNHAGRSDFEGSEPQRRAELRQLDELSRKLALLPSRR